MVNDRGRLIVTAPDSTTANNVHQGYAVTVRERATSGIRRVVATVVEPPA